MKKIVVIIPTKIVKWGLNPKVKWLSAIPRKDEKMLNRTSDGENVIRIYFESIILQIKKDNRGTVVM